MSRVEAAEATESVPSSGRMIVLLIRAPDERLPGGLAGEHTHVIMSDARAATMAVDYLRVRNFAARWIEVSGTWRCDECGRFPSTVT